jgi:hypothetical protein
MKEKELLKIKTDLKKVKIEVSNSLMLLNSEVEHAKNVKDSGRLVEKYLAPTNNLLDRDDKKSWFNRLNKQTGKISKLVYSEGFEQKKLAFEILDLYKSTLNLILKIQFKMSNALMPFLVR